MQATPNATSKAPEQIQKKDTKNDMFENLRKKYIDSLTPEDIEAYKKFGEKFYSVDFTTNLPDNTKTINLEECLANICRGLDSGLHPSYIEKDEENLLKAAYGLEWYKRWGYENKKL